MKTIKEGPVTTNRLKKLLEIDIQTEKENIIRLIREQLKQLNKDGVVLGLSGGLDSSTCAYLVSEALGTDKILGLILPERDSGKINMEHARLVAKNLAIRTVEIDISGVLENIGVYKIGPGELKTEADIERMKQKKELSKQILGAGDHLAFKRLAIMHGIDELPDSVRPMGEVFYKNNAFSLTKVRTRMLHLYYHAWLHNYAVIGTLDKSEYSIGLFDPHGDGASDIAILRHLYKSQIKQLATWIGVPREITHKKSSGDLYGNEAWEDAMGLTYEQLDQVLSGLDQGYPEEEIIQIVDKEGLDAIKKGRKVSELIRSLPIALG